MPEEKKLGERAGTKTLDYIALGLLLAPPTVVVDMYLKGDHSINWQKTAITAVICWVAGALVVLASDGWQSWRSTDGRVWPYLIAAENKFWVKGLIVAASMGFALALSSILSNKGDNPPVSPIAATPPTAEDIAKAIAPIQAKLDAANRQLQSRLDVTERQLTETKRQLNAVQQTPFFAPTPTNQGPIIWHVDSQLLVVSGGAPTAVVNGLIFQGTSTASVSIKEAYVVSGLTGRKQVLVANVQSKGAYYPVDKVDIPPDAPVQLDLIFNPELPLRDFSDQWGQFRVTVVYNNGVPYERDFDEAYVRQKLRQQVPNAFGPRVTPKEDK